MRNSCRFCFMKWLMNRPAPVGEVSGARKGVSDASADQGMEARPVIKLPSLCCAAVFGDGGVDGGFEAEAFGVVDGVDAVPVLFRGEAAPGRVAMVDVMPSGFHLVGGPAAGIVVAQGAAVDAGLEGAHAGFAGAVVGRVVGR